MREIDRRWPSPYTLWSHLIIVGLSCSGCLLVFLIWHVIMRRRQPGRPVFYFDAQDAKAAFGEQRAFPRSADSGTFEPLLGHYLDVIKLFVGLAAASIVFGGNQSGSSAVFAAKLILAFSVLYGVVFCASMLYLYDEYTQDLMVYTRERYAFIEAMWFSGVTCFIAGYAVWALKLP